MTPEEEAIVEARIAAKLDTRIRELNMSRDATQAENIERLKGGPGWKSSEFWLAAVPTITGAIVTLAEVFGLSPEHVEVVQQVAGVAAQAATGLASGSDPADVAAGALMATIPSALYILKRTARK